MNRDWCLIYMVMTLCMAMDVLGAPQEDLVQSLPGQPPSVAFKQYAGYVNVDNNSGSSGRYLFYYFAEAETDPSSKPLVIWFNGGPGCSSFGVGALSENGPFQPSGTTLVQNEYSWNKEANMLYIESPAGVGFSYSLDQVFYVGVNDSITAQDNLAFLRGWYNKFPEYKSRDLFLTGESYAGHYIPQLAELIIETNGKEGSINLKGVAIGNPLLEFFTDFNARSEYLWSHGLVSDVTYNNMQKVCNYSRFMDEYYRNILSSECEELYNTVSMEVSNFVDRYDVTLDVCLSSISMQTNMLKVKNFKNSGPDVCVQDEASAYLNIPEVQKALHAKLSGKINKWQACSDVVMYNELDLEIPTIPILGKLVKAGIKVLIYSGDQDSIIPLTGSRTLVNNIAKSLQLESTVPYSVWFQGKQVGGWTEVYDNMLSFATVRGASHEAPFSQPERSFVLFTKFLQGQPLPSNITILTNT